MKNKPSVDGQVVSLRDAILTLLRHGMSVDMLGDASIFLENKCYVVSYLPTEFTGKAGGLDEIQAKMMDSDNEMMEYFDTPEEAADLFMKIHEHSADLVQRW